MEIEENIVLRYGTIVKMTEDTKAAFIKNDCKEHVDEFGDCLGVVEDLVDYNNDGENDPDKIGPEYNIRWYPNGLRYGYTSDKLEVQTKPHITDFLSKLSEEDISTALSDFYRWQETSEWWKGNVIEQINTIYFVPIEGVNGISGRIAAYHYVCGELASRWHSKTLSK